MKRAIVLIAFGPAALPLALVILWTRGVWRIAWNAADDLLAWLTFDPHDHPDEDSIHVVLGGELSDGGTITLSNGQQVSASDLFVKTE